MEFFPAGPFFMRCRRHITKFPYSKKLSMPLKISDCVPVPYAFFGVRE